jgi:pimeloyl-ACP methyl ester carboxylesterase
MLFMGTRTMTMTQAENQHPPLSAQHVPGYEGIRLAVDFAGHPHGPPVVMLHGGGQTRYAWRSAVLALAAHGYYVAAMDLRGHGDSEWSPLANYTLTAQVGDTLAVIGKMPSTPAVIGASMGGQIAMTTAARHPDAVRALVLVDVTPQVDRAGRARIIGFMQARPEGFASLEEAADAIAGYLPHRPRPRDLSGLQRNLKHHADGRYYWHWDPKMLASYEPDADEGERRYAAAASAVRAPTLLVRGGKSELVTPDNVRHFRELMPYAEFVDVMDAAHMIAGDSNDAFNAAVIEFLDRVFCGHGVHENR